MMSELTQAQSSTGIYIGIYGGHQSSYAVAMTDEKVLGCVSGESLNLHTYSPAVVVVRLKRLLNDLSVRIGINASRLQDRTRRMVLALPGAATETDQLLTEFCIHQNGWRDVSKYTVVDDTWAGLYAGTFSASGVCAFAGTGASVFIGLGNFRPGRLHKIDGWGPVLGDHGSGFQLVVDFFRFLGRELDKGIVPALFDEVLEYDKNIENIENVQNWFDQLFIFYPEDWRIKFAELAIPINQAANRKGTPDITAIRIVSEAAMSMAQTIDIALTRYANQTEELPIVLQGGMFEHSVLYRDTVISTIKDKYPNSIYLSPYHTVIGAALLALTNSAPRVDLEIVAPLLKSINTLSEKERIVLSRIPT
jgi:N-acetylglucosamine kinase-like BadF-type ATPase